MEMIAGQWRGPVRQRTSGPMRTAIMSCTTCSPRRMPAS